MQGRNCFLWHENEFPNSMPNVAEWLLLTMLSADWPERSMYFSNQNAASHEDKSNLLPEGKPLESISVDSADACSSASERALKRLWIVLGPAACLALLPFFLLARYCQPSADDFHYAYRIHENGFWESQWYWYQLTGRYVNTAIISLLCGYMDLNDWYWLFPSYILVGLLLSTWLLLWRLNKLIPYPVAPVHIGLATLLLVTLHAVYMPSPAEGFYWLCGAQTYEGATILAVLCAACLVPPANPETKVQRAMRFAFASLFAMLAVGSNELMVVFLGGWLTAGTIFCFLRRRELFYCWLMVLIVTAASAAVVACCPGIGRRMAIERGDVEPEFFPVMAATSLYVGISIAKLLASPAVILLSVLWLYFLRQQTAGLNLSDQKFCRLLLFLPLMCLLLILLTAFPPWWALGAEPQLRVQNMVHWACLWSWFVSLTSIATASGPACWRWLPHSPRVIWGASLLVVVSFFMPSQERIAWNDWRVFASGYLEQHQFRVELIRKAHADGQTRVQFPRLRNVPLTIHSWDVTIDPNHWMNDGTARYYGVTEIWKLPADADMKDEDAHFKQLKQ